MLGQIIMEKKNNMPRSSNLRKTFVRLLSTAGPVIALIIPGVAFAQTAVNTARITAPAGTFEINPSNNESTDTDTVLAVMVATNDSAIGINGLAGATAVVNAFTGDTVNGVAASPSNATLSVVPGAVPAGLTFNAATGSVDVAAGTPAGTYSFLYTICESLNPTNCQTATISVTVVAAPIAADPDSVAGINGANGASNVLDVIAGDTLNGAQVTLAQVNLTVTTPATPASPGAPVPTLNVATGQISVPAGTPAGTYTITYKICEQLNPANCSSNIATVTVAAAPIVATNDSAIGINGLAGATAVVNAFTGDTVNGVAASPSNATLSVVPGAVPAGLTFNAATGSVDVAAGTPAGTYSFLYTICESLNPTNCQTATISVTVVAAPIAADPDSVAASTVRMAHLMFSMLSQVIRSTVRR
jgi:large repetitive protein